MSRLIHTYKIDDYTFLHLTAWCERETFNEDEALALRERIIAYLEALPTEDAEYSLDHGGLTFAVSWRTDAMPRRKKQLRLGRLRKTVRQVNTIYGLLVQAHDALRGQVIELESRVIELERRAGLTWSHRESAYLDPVAAQRR